MKTVIQFITSLSDGGAETLVKDYGILFKRHPELQIRCIIVTLHNTINSANYQRLKNAGVEVVSIYKHHNKLISLHRCLFGSWYVPKKFLAIIKHYKPSAIHMHLEVLNYCKAISKELRGIKLFYTCHSEPSVMYKKKNGEKESACYLIKNNSLQMIALHEIMKCQLNQIFGIDNTIVVNNGVDFPTFRNVNETKEDIRKRLNVPINAFVVGHIGRFCYPKNHPFLLKVFVNLLKMKNNAFMILIGNGQTKNQIINECNNLGISDKVLILSNRTDIPQLLKSMDVFVFPSFYEGLSITLIEAQVSGLRCIISDKIKEYNVLSKTTIQMSLEESTEQWCNAILDQDRNNTFHYSLSNYDMNFVIEGLAKLYSSK